MGEGERVNLHPCMQCCNAASAIYNVNRHSCCGDVLGSVGC